MPTTSNPGCPIFSASSKGWGIEPTARLLLKLIAATLLAAPTLHAQNLPPTTPTAPSAPPAITLQKPARRAQIYYTNNLLTITADNSSLNQILRDIAQRTGMTITGGVNDERVFGTYGPADASTILTALLDGTGSNMLLTLNSNQGPRELILTPRQGGPTPPSPNTYRDAANSNDLSPQSNPRFGKLPAKQFTTPPPLPPDQNPQPAQPPTQPTAVTLPTPTPTRDTSTTTQQSPNGVKTPQQIYEQLMQMQQQQKATSPPPPR